LKKAILEAISCGLKSPIGYHEIFNRFLKKGVLELNKFI